MDTRNARKFVAVMGAPTGTVHLPLFPTIFLVFRLTSSSRDLIDQQQTADTVEMVRTIQIRGVKAVEHRYFVAHTHIQAIFVLICSGSKLLVHQASEFISYCRTWLTNLPVVDLSRSIVVLRFLMASYP